MDIDDKGHDHHFGEGAHPQSAEALGASVAGIEHVTPTEAHVSPEAHTAAAEVHGLVAASSVDVNHLTTNLEHLGPEHALTPDHDFGTHQDTNLHDSIHHIGSLLGFEGETHHGLGEIADDHHHDPGADHHHGFDVGLHG
jgi:hypothetical protein